MMSDIGNGLNLNISTNPFLKPRMAIPVFSERQDAMNYPMGPDSSIIGLDSSQQLMWIVKTGPNGEKVMCDAFHIGEKYVPEPEPDIRDLQKRIEGIETNMGTMFEQLGKRFDKFEEMIK